MTGFVFLFLFFFSDAVVIFVKQELLFLSFPKRKKDLTIQKGCIKMWRGLFLY